LVSIQASWENRVQESKAKTKARIRNTFTCSVTTITLTEEISKHYCMKNCVGGRGGVEYITLVHLRMEHFWPLQFSVPHFLLPASNNVTD
jgi:hypothetical protein